MNRNFERASQRPERIDTVIIPIAGKGTRLLPTTKAIPKFFQTVGDLPLIQYAVEEARRAGIKKFVFVVDDDPLNRELIEKHFLPQEGLEEHLTAKGMLDKVAEIRRLQLKPEQLAFVVQDKPTGMWDAIERSRPFITGDAFAVISPDDLILPAMAGLPDLIKHHQRGTITIDVEQTPMEDISKFGVIKYSDAADGTMAIEDVVEKPPQEEAPSDMAIAGRYIFPTSIFEAFTPAVKPSVKNEISLSHAIKGVSGVIPAYAAPIPGTKYDGGSRAGLAMANMRVYAEDAEITAAIEKKNRQKTRTGKTYRNGLRAVR